MVKKLLSLAVACAMLSTSAFAEVPSLNKFVQDHYGITSGVYEIPQINTTATAYVKSVSSSFIEEGTAKSSTNNFDFKVTLDMENVSNAFSLLKSKASSVIGTSYATQLNDSSMKSQFKVHITYTSGLGNISDICMSDIALVQGGDLFVLDADASTIGASSADIIFKVKDGKKVSDLNNTELGDLQVTLTGFTANNTGTVTAQLDPSSYVIFTEDVNDNNKDYGKITFASNVTEATAQTYTSGGGGGGGIAIPRVTVITEDDKIILTPAKTNGKYYIDIDSIDVPDKDGQHVEGFYLDPDFTNPVGGVYEVKNSINLYPKYGDGEPVSKAPTAKKVVNGETTPVPVDENDGVYSINVDEIEKPAKDGLVFDGWYTDPYFTNEAEGIFEITKDTTLYPHFVNVTAPVDLISDEHVAYIAGYPDKEVKPNRNITREEIAMIFYRLLTDERRTAILSSFNTFGDVEAERWSNQAISTMANGGYIYGDNNGNFRPADSITRAEFVAIATRFMGYTAGNNATNYFTDIDGHWAYGAILAATNDYSWITGYSDGTFKPDRYISRAEAMTIINRMLVRYGDANAELAHMWPDLSVNDWYYTAVIEASLSHTFTRRADGWNEDWSQNWVYTEMP